jgi:excisionase family DNA binding protein
MTSHTTNDDDKLLTIEEVAKIINKSEQTVRRMIKTDKIKAELIEGHYGKQYYIKSSDIHQAYSTLNVVPLTRAVSVPALVEEIMTRVAQENAILRNENAQMKADIQEVKETQARIENSLRERDEKLMTAIRDRQEERKEQNKKVWWKVWE